MTNLHLYEFYSNVLKDTRSEKQKLHSFAKRIKKVPEIIHIPGQYFIKRERRTRSG